MPAPVTHIALAHIALQGPFSLFNEKEFIIGTSYPDIRYITGIDRNLTHPQQVTLEQIAQETSSFKAGMLIHAYADQQVRVFFNTLENKTPEEKQLLHSSGAKFYLDKHVYNKINDWEKIISYFDTILPEEHMFDITTEQIKTWHNGLAWYLKNPGKLEESPFASVLPQEHKDLIATNFKKIERSQEYQHIILRSFDFIADKLREI